MQERPSVVERAFQIAKSGSAANLAELSRQLVADGYENAEQLLGNRSVAMKVSRMITGANPPRVS